MKIGSMAGAALALTASVLVGGLSDGTSRLAGLFVPQAQAQALQDSEKDRYVREHQDRFESWGKKIDAFRAKAAKRGSEAGDKAKRDLDEAWSDVKTGWAKLKSASRDGWQDAKEALETNWRRLERAWSDAQS